MKFGPAQWKRFLPLFAFLIALTVEAVICQTVVGQLIEPIEIPIGEKQRVKFWLDPAWKKNLASRTQSVEVYELAPVNSPTVLIAYAVNRFQHNRVREAGEAVDAALAITPDNLDARLLSIWVKTVRDQYDQAMTDIRTFGKTIRNRNLPPARLDNTYRRIGRLLGYLQGPVGEHVNQEILHAAIAELSIGLAPNHQKLMRAEMENLLADFEGRMQHLGRKVQESVEEKEVAKVANRKLIQQENALLQTQTQTIQDQQNSLRDEGELKIDRAISRAQPLQSELAALDGDIRSVRNNIRALQTALYFHQTDPNGSLLQCDVLRYQIQDNYFTLGNLGNRADAVAFELDRAANEIAQIRNRYGGQLSQLERDLANSGRRQRRNSKKLAKLAKPTKPNNKKVTLLSNRITALNSYDQLPLELYRVDLLKEAATP